MLQRTTPSLARARNTITLRDLRVATRKSNNKIPPCNEELDNVIAALARSGPDSGIETIPKQMQALDECLKTSKQSKARKDTTLYHLSKYIAK